MDARSTAKLRGRQRLALAGVLGLCAVVVTAQGARHGQPYADAQSACYGDFADLKAWWPLDEDALGDGATDAVHGNTARHVGSPAVAAGQRGLARTYGKNAQWSEVRAPATGLDLLATDITMDAWIRLPLGSSRAIVSRTGRVALAEKKSSAGGAGYAFYLDSGFLGLQIADSNGRISTFSSRSGPTLGAGGGLLDVDGQWHFAAVTVRRTGVGTGVRFSLDGVGTNATDAAGGRPPALPAGSLANDSPFRFGRRMAGSGSGGSPVLLDNIEVFGRALGAAELDAIRTNGKCAPTPSGFATATGTATAASSATSSATSTSPVSATATITSTATVSATTTAPAVATATEGPATDTPTETGTPPPATDAATNTATATTTPSTTATPSTTPTPTPSPTASPRCTDAPASLAAWWPLDEGAGPIAGDASGGGHDGELDGSAGWRADGAVRGALSFDGQTALVVVPDADGLDVPSAAAPAPTGDFTIELWLRRRERGPALQAVFDKLTRDQGYSLMLSDGKPIVYLASAGLMVPTPFDATLALDGAWHHLAVVLDRHVAAVRARLFIDGAFIASGSAIVTGSLANDVPVRLGGSNLSPYVPFSGDMDEVSFYQRALTDAEIAAIARAGGKCR
ncbi:MAG: LamG-like jellyroll fold domain-containing protein [Ardenticatenales bacterium]